MDARTRRPRQAPVRRAALVLATFLLAVAACLGGVRAVALATTKPADPAALDLGAARLHVSGVEEVVGVAASDLMGGMAHNISGMVSDDQMMVLVSVSVTAGDAPASYDAKVLAARALGSSVELHPVGGTLGSGRLSPHARIEGSVAFVVPRNGAHLVLGVRGSHRTIDLAVVDRAVPSHHEHDTARE